MSRFEFVDQYRQRGELDYCKMLVCIGVVEHLVRVRFVVVERVSRYHQGYPGI